MIIDIVLYTIFVSVMEAKIKGDVLILSTIFCIICYSLAQLYIKFLQYLNDKKHK